MKRHLAPLFICLTLTAQPCAAREPQAPPAPSGDAAAQSKLSDVSSGKKSIFVGRYGEIIELKFDWTAEAEMRDETEAVYFHRKSKEFLGFKPFQPKKSDYKAENFSPMGLMELVVIPKNAPGGMRSLKDLRRAKEQELKRQGADYKIFDEEDGDDWPRGTFHVRTERPYRLQQTYSESPKEFYIFTAGGILETGDYNLGEDLVLDYRSAKDLATRSLKKNLKDLRHKTAGGRLFYFQKISSDDIFSGFKDYSLGRDASPLSLKILATTSFAMLGLALWPGRTGPARRTRLFGRSLLLFTSLVGFTGFLVVFIPARLFGLIWNSRDLAMAAPIPFIPLIAWAAAYGSGSVHAKRVLAATGTLGVLWVTLFLLSADFKTTDPSPISTLGNTLFSLIVGLTFGFVFALSFGPVPNKEASQ